MSWSVLWRPMTEDDLANIWLDADDKAAITLAANRIDAQLRRDPFAIGESRDKDRRIHFESPLGVLYRVNAMDRTVLVLRVWRIA